MTIDLGPPPFVFPKPAITRPATADLLRHGEPALAMLFAPGLKVARNNLLTKTEQFDDAIWLRSVSPYPITVTANATTDPLGGSTADLLTCAATYHHINQQVAVSPSTQYTFSWYAKKGTLDPKYGLHDYTHGASIVPQTAYAATSSWQRFSVTFTTPAGCVLIGVYPVHNSANASTATLYVWGAMLNLGAAALPYQMVK